MRIDNDVARACLSEDLRQHNRVKKPRINNILEHISRTDTRQLVYVTHQDQPCSGYDCFQQRVHQRDIDHRHLIDDDHIRLERILLIPFKASISFHTAVQFQHAVNRARLKSGRLTHTLRCASRRCRKEDIHAFRFKIFNDRIDRCCLSGSRSTGDHKHTVSDCFLDRFHLMLI